MTQHSLRVAGVFWALDYDLSLSEIPVAELKRIERAHVEKYHGR